jgi:cytidyltransferase-like protein
LVTKLLSLTFCFYNRVVAYFKKGLDVNSVNRKRYRRVAVGGTFDKLHKGHEKLIDKAFDIGKHVLIGLTADKMLKNNTKLFPTAPYASRKKALLRYLKKKGVKSTYQIVPLVTPYGVTLSDGELEALVVSYKTSSRAKEINMLREERGLKPLKLIIIEMVLSEDGLPISTTRIKRGEIDRDGRALSPTK